ncbi:MAG: diaminobutyrate--2-oxoglutarate transaminase [Pseudomonadales bacterium]|uniref:aspartate aminotransferase family protein n=1 Tax=unclassified Ketobacter TaxID=2639109 RepID=UPI000C43166C|nr:MULTISPECIES: aspartate aminotransferase family protein [unclassified Ketobacter]MAQ26060.1 diaminobutyrate--2-oxoglutarate transaminase [Pseudomonadales bacterium]MEC8812298.1 aspartate aminotransferase family protein [Pseudomonadota bacterium]MBI25502.1 diaminobutyrate--2-oxoglutarate transaminase [Pseudomonadales bacterium]MCK5789435.1 aspartate aminotransferase family protein [Ketobacter sp.]RLT89360.1 MAG: aspartate aminotransferase family protein [Ketobacter sp. GenoA1]|tara:strand:- start:7608 stop:8882 length:1275 start_codon:yes stop_codon:yes gene_type:complete
MSIFEERESSIRAYSRMFPVVFSSAKNARQTDENGKEYIDFFAGAGVLNFGHNNERMIQAMIDYMQKDGVLHSLDMQTSAKANFMQRFTDVILAPRNMPHRMQFMGPTGTNAVEAAMKLARRATGRHQIVAFSHGFHGMTLGALAATANQYFRGASGVPLLHVSHEPFGCETRCVGCEADCGIQSLQALASRYRDPSSGLDAPAAFLVEVIQAEGGVNVAGKEWLKALSALARELGAVLIVDEIQVGCGRTGSYFSFDDMDVEPDIICLAKGIGGIGTPMAMNLVHPELDKHWSPGEHTGTFRGQNLSFVAGAEALSYFENDELMQEVAEKTQLTRTQLEPLLKADNSLQLRGKGLIMGLDVRNGERATAIVKRCFEHGLIIASCGTGGRVLKLIPPLTIPREDLLAGLDILVDAVRFVMEEAA